MQYRQGDVIIKKVKSIKGKKLKHLTLAEGEVTGHSHRITEGDCELYDEGDIKFLRVKSENAKLSHQEHKEIVLPQGDYEINIQREYSPEGWRRVAD